MVDLLFQLCCQFWEGLRLQRCNFRLMLIRSFRDGVLDCFKYKNSDVISIMEITDGVGLNRLVPSACAIHTQAFNCYDCWSVLAPGCGEPFKPDAAGVTVKPATLNQSCIASRETHVDGSEGIARAVVDLTECTFGKNQCQIELNGDVTKTTCCCSSDLCNGHVFTPGSTTISHSAGCSIFLQATLFIFMLFLHCIMSEVVYVSI
ncbi:unnamed protein product [Rotaria socialis]|uniref:Uncharacterized protein n=2 Tax=Rotaria socialis TaxID=392032 RepID=A0A821MHV4_9BILA|nr:unnamed protein product [Rotaria socialis]